MTVIQTYRRGSAPGEPIRVRPFLGGVNPPSRFGEFRMEGNELVEFVEKPELHSAWINGGYFFFHRWARNLWYVSTRVLLRRYSIAFPVAVLYSSSAFQNLL
jgi:hypothetical protein